MRFYLIFWIAILLNSCQKNNTKLYVGTNAEFPPFEYLEKNEILGFDIDIIKALASEMDKEIIIKNLSWEGLLPALQVRKIDLAIAAISITKDRERVVNFSDSYYTSKEQAIVLIKNNSLIQSIEDFKGRSIGVVLGFTADTLLTQQEEHFKIKRFNGAFDAICALRKGTLDAILMDNELARAYQKEMTDISIIPGNNTEEKYCIAIHKKDLQLMASINRAIKIIKANGVYDKIYKRYF